MLHRAQTVGARVVLTTHGGLDLGDFISTEKRLASWNETARMRK
jgi:hypothetical protein